VQNGKKPKHESRRRTIKEKGDGGAGDKRIIQAVNIHMYENVTMKFVNTYN
jgi:hypothetical protein